MRLAYDCIFPNAGLDDSSFEFETSDVHSGKVEIDERNSPSQDYWGTFKIRSIEMRFGKPWLVLHYV